MFARMFRRRPRRVAVAAAIAALATGLVASVAVAALVTDSGTHSVIVPNKETSSALVDIGNASVKYIGSSAQDQASGTGLFDPFVRLQADTTEQGWIGQDVILRQLLACWLVVDPSDRPLSPRL